MIEKIRKYERKEKGIFDFSVVIPTWNNLEMLKLCVSSIRKNSELNLQIIVFVNEGSDGTLEWLENEKDIDYLYSYENIGICYSLNSARSLVKSDYLLYLNDDMYVLPAWDRALKDEIEGFNTKNFMLSATMIEPVNTGNKCVIVKDYGRNSDDFNENKLLAEFKDLFRSDWSGSTWPPNIVHVDLWDAVGGLSVEFSPGMYSDPDFSKKLYDAGVRIFKGSGRSLVYHFGAKTTGRIRKNSGRNTFLMKWGITSSTFTREYLHIGEEYQPLPRKVELSKYTIFVNRLKKIIYSITEK